MVNTVLFLSLVTFASLVNGGPHHSDELIKSLTNDANLDLSVDEEYEELRAELLAYHTGLIALMSSVGNGTENGGRRSILSKSCWEQGGICVRQSLCDGKFYKHQIPGCKDKKNVCCFTWNEYKVRDHRGLAGPGYPWSEIKQPFQGRGVVVENKGKGKKKKSKKTKRKEKKLAAESFRFDMKDLLVPKKLSDAKAADDLVVLNID